MHWSYVRFYEMGITLGSHSLEGGGRSIYNKSAT